MPWIIKTRTRLPTGDDSVEFFGSGINDQQGALAHVRQAVPDGEAWPVCEVSEAELIEMGVPQGRSEMIRFDEAAFRTRHPDRFS